MQYFNCIFLNIYYLKQLFYVLTPFYIKVGEKHNVDNFQSANFFATTSPIYMLIRVFLLFLRAETVTNNAHEATFHHQNRY